MMEFLLLYQNDGFEIKYIFECYFISSTNGKFFEIHLSKSDLKNILHQMKSLNLMTKSDKGLLFKFANIPGKGEISISSQRLKIDELENVLDILDPSSKYTPETRSELSSYGEVCLEKKHNY